MSQALPYTCSDEIWTWTLREESVSTYIPIIPKWKEHFSVQHITHIMKHTVRVITEYVRAICGKVLLLIPARSVRNGIHT